MTDNVEPTHPRRWPPHAADERPMLDGWLDFQRDTLLWKCQGLTPEQLRMRSVPPSDLSLWGLVRHMAEVEKHWFRHVLDGEAWPEPRRGIWWTREAGGDEDADLHPGPDDDWDADVSVFHDQVRLAREISARHHLDELRSDHGRELSHRWILVHMIEEYARHNGHADLLREAIDGVTGD